jgi:hypothetical protein
MQIFKLGTIIFEVHKKIKVWESTFVQLLDFGGMIVLKAQFMHVQIIAD